MWALDVQRKLKTQLSQALVKDKCYAAVCCMMLTTHACLIDPMRTADSNRQHTDGVIALPLGQCDH